MVKKTLCKKKSVVNNKKQKNIKKTIKKGGGQGQEKSYKVPEGFSPDQIDFYQFHDQNNIHNDHDLLSQIPVPIFFNIDKLNEINTFLSEHRTRDEIDEYNTMTNEDKCKSDLILLYDYLLTYKLKSQLPQEPKYKPMLSASVSAGAGASAGAGSSAGAGKGASKIDYFTKYLMITDKRKFLTELGIVGLSEKQISNYNNLTQQQKDRINRRFDAIEERKKINTLANIHHVMNILDHGPKPGPGPKKQQRK